MDGTVFQVCFEQVWPPAPSLGDIVIMVNFPAHKSAATPQTIEAASAKPVFLPPGSLSLDPIEMAFTWLQALAPSRPMNDRPTSPRLFYLPALLSRP